MGPFNLHRKRLNPTTPRINIQKNESWTRSLLKARTPTCLDIGGRSFPDKSGQDNMKIACDTGHYHTVYACGVRDMLCYGCMRALGGTFWREQLECSFGGVPISWANEKIRD